MIERTDKLNHITSGFDRSPMVSITGLRQSGKTTLAKEFASHYQGSWEKKILLNKNITANSLPSILSKIGDL
jgi:predicted AAA+ superfamily ATPase